MSDHQPSPKFKTGPIAVDWERVIRDTARTDRLLARTLRHGRTADGERRRYRSDGLVKGVPWFHLDQERQQRGYHTRRAVQPIEFTSKQYAEAEAWRQRRAAA